MKTRLKRSSRIRIEMVCVFAIGRVGGSSRDSVGVGESQPESVLTIVEKGWCEINSAPFVTPTLAKM